MDELCTTCGAYWPCTCPHAQIPVLGVNIDARLVPPTSQFGVRFGHDTIRNDDASFTHTFTPDPDLQYVAPDSQTLGQVDPNWRDITLDWQQPSDAIVDYPIDLSHPRMGAMKITAVDSDGRSIDLNGWSAAAQLAQLRATQQLPTPKRKRRKRR